MAEFTLLETGLDELQELIVNYAGNAGPVIDKVLYEQGGDIIIDNIKPLIHPSGRSWRGKKKSAVLAEPFRKEGITMGVVVKTTTAYNYLYFPDDGSNTVNHRGQQNFSGRGLEQSVDTLIDLCIDALTNI